MSQIELTLEELRRVLRTVPVRPKIHTVPISGCKINGELVDAQLILPRSSS